jgi:FixJ family two-component response regulator/glycine cleavage system H lipoate-binding protein
MHGKSVEREGRRAMKQREAKRSCQVIVVDDEASVCKSVRRILEREQLVVDEALSAKEAIGIIEKGEYAVVITDMMMPGMGGLDLLRVVKERWPQTSVIMITGYATIKTAVQSIKMGAFDYLPKPFTPEELASVTRRAIERAALYEKEAKEEVVRPEHKVGEAQRDRYYILEHSWAFVENGTVKIGMDDIFQKTTGQIINIDLPFEGDVIEQGRVCVRITSAGMRIHKLWSPVTGKVVEVNDELNKDPGIANRDPYGKGWLVRVNPLNLGEELDDLVLLKK